MLYRLPGVLVHWDDVARDRFEWEPETAAWWRDLGRAAGARGVGVRRMEVDPGKQSEAAHMDTAEEEIFVVLDGSGTVLLGDDEHPLRRGHVVARPPGTRISHTFRADEEPLTLLVYGTREPSDITYYPRSRTFWVRGIGVIGRAEGLSREDVW